MPRIKQMKGSSFRVKPGRQPQMKMRTAPARLFKPGQSAAVKAYQQACNMSAESYGERKDRLVG